MKYILCDNIEFQSYEKYHLAILDNNNQGIFIMTESAKLVLEFLQTAKTFDELLALLLSIYSVNPDEAKKDLNKLLEEMIKLKVVCKVDN